MAIDKSGDRPVRWGVISRLSGSARVGLGFIALIVLVGIFAPLVITHDPTSVGLAPANQGPSGDFWFGVV